ncbi:ATP-binding protein [Paenibacillus sp. IHB B 3415]|uniref:ATP-binding protein n=1 Tax=Paenibacillus sp. IHB B 3415 TaxID=867080 RepID=UPI00069A9AA2|nr:ATP-binding protein [Paenibacillus sp. IHB B 3415]
MAVSATSFHEMVRVINEQVFTKASDLDDLFSPKKYLVSPLNSTNEFMQQNYFLTDQQEVIKKRIINAFDNQQIHCAQISGAAGTGKTLLAYDIAYHYIKQNIPVCIIHCGKLSEGHEKLRIIYGWNIYEIKHYLFALQIVENGGVVVIDEAQRIFVSQIDHLIHSEDCVWDLAH